jgi:ribonuclease P protein component
VSKRVGNAVVRNHVKRRIREWFRGGRGQLETDIDLVVIGRSAAAQLTGREISNQLAHATRELGLAGS